MAIAGALGALYRDEV